MAKVGLQLASHGVQVGRELIDDGSRRLLIVYSHVPREQIAETLLHLRGLFRGIAPSSEEDLRAQLRRESLTKSLLSNLHRTKDHPTLGIVLQVADAFSLTLDGAHRLFGYDLERMREYDLSSNAGRTHIIETYPFQRDRLIDLPYRFADDPVFSEHSSVDELVVQWATDTPIRALESEIWQLPNAFYIKVGTEDSLGSSLPPGATAAVGPIEETERLRPNPRGVYLLQFGNGYRCSRCVVTRGKLLLLTSGRKYIGPQEFRYPGGVRIAGRIRMFAVSLPLPEYPLLHSLPASQESAPLILPWEHTSMDRLFRAKHLRFRRSKQDLNAVREKLEAIFHTTMSDRTERRYRRATSSLPHVNSLLQLTVTHLARYTDALRVQRLVESDRGKYSLDTLLNSSQLPDLPKVSHHPLPRDRWTALRRDYMEWPAALSMRYPKLQSLSKRIVRLSDGVLVQGLDPPLAAGSLLLLENTSSVPDLPVNTPVGWSRRLYMLHRGSEHLYGYLDRDGSQYVLLAGAHGSLQAVSLQKDDLTHLHQIRGVAVPV